MSTEGAHFVDQLNDSHDSAFSCFNRNSESRFRAVPDGLVECIIKTKRAILRKVVTVANTNRISRGCDVPRNTVRIDINELIDNFVMFTGALTAAAMKA